MKLDLGSGPRPKEGFEGCDRIAFDGVSHVFDIGKDPWPFADGSVEEVFSAHFLEHLEPLERIHLANELYRVLKPGGHALIVTPHWANAAAYGDPTHIFPPISEWSYLYWGREWREQHAPHTDIAYNHEGFACDFSCELRHGMHPADKAPFELHARLTRQ